MYKSIGIEKKVFLTSLWKEFIALIQTTHLVELNLVMSFLFRAENGCLEAIELFVLCDYVFGKLYITSNLTCYL